MNHKHTNWLFDEVMPRVDANAFRIICIVARKTWGWNKNTDTISVSQFVKLSGIKTRTTALKAIGSALESGFVARSKVGQSYVYQMRFNEKLVQKLDQPASTETIPDSHKTSTETIPTSLETVPELVQKLDPQIEKKYKEVYKLAKTFENTTGFFLPIDLDTEYNQENWVRPLEAIGSQSESEGRIEYAVQKMREGNYTIKTPKSILTFALNWSPSLNGQVTKSKDGGMYV
jgi:hypothetical protein